MKEMFKKRNNIGKYIIGLIFVITIGTITCVLLQKSSDNHVVTTKKPSEQVIPTPVITKKLVHIAAMGDMIAHDTIIANAKTNGSYDFAQYFSNIRSSYGNADAIFCNQEGISSGEKYGISGYPSFNAPKQYSSNLQSGAGCNVISLANNHTGDKSISAINDTIDGWNALKPLAFSGANKTAADQETISYFEKNGIKFSFIAFADYNNKSTPGYVVNIYHNEALLRRLITSARSNSDVVMVSMHWGKEDSGIINADQSTQVNLLSTLGVDIVFGTGPHVLQKVKTIDRSDGGKMIVWYSLGNMLSSQLNINQLIGGIATMDVERSTNNKITINNLSFIPTYMHYEWTKAQAANTELLSRKNVMIYLLSQAADPLSRSLFKTTIEAQKQYVIDTLGSEVTVK